MARVLGKLPAIGVRNLNTRVLYADGGCLYLQVTETKAKAWVFRFDLSGRRRHMGLGFVNTVTRAEAREVARRCRQLVRDRVDPISRRQTAKRAAQSRGQEDQDLHGMRRT